jgi:hypothetical protein
MEHFSARSLESGMTSSTDNARSSMRQIQLLTHRYENRIRHIEAQHEGEAIALRDSVFCETKKAELDIQQKVSTQLVELAKLKQAEIDGLREQLE